MERSEEVKDLVTALSKFQGTVNNAIKNAKGIHNNKYADLAEVWNTIRGPLSDNNLSVTQFVSNLDDKVGVQTSVYHSSGQFLSEVFHTRPAKNGIHELGSCISYLRRYCLAAILGIAQQDDDGQMEEDAHKKPKKPKVDHNPTELKDEIISLLNNLNRKDLNPTVNKSVEEAKDNVDKLLKILNRLKKLR
jgi:hypothetical protein